jgi:hypothetical protein
MYLRLLMEESLCSDGACLVRRVTQQHACSKEFHGFLIGLGALKVANGI